MSWTQEHLDKLGLKQDAYLDKNAPIKKENGCNVRLNVKPLSVNKVFQGRRFRTKEYDLYESRIKKMLPILEISEGKLSITYTVGYSSSASDIDNFVKPFQDILSKHYKFNDNKIYHVSIYKEIVKKGLEFIDFSIVEYSSEQP